MSDFKVHHNNKAKAPVSRKGPAQKAGDSTKQNQRPLQKGDTVKISKEGKEKDAKQHQQDDGLNEDFVESAQGDDDAPKQGDKKPKSTAGSAQAYDGEGKMIKPVEKGKTYGVGYEVGAPKESGDYPTIDLEG